jgi:hypothetical protein
LRSAEIVYVSEVQAPLKKSKEEESMQNEDGDSKIHWNVKAVKPFQGMVARLRFSFCIRNNNTREQTAE